MTNTAIVELVCKAESRTVGKIETVGGKLTAVAIKRGIRRSQKLGVPNSSQIFDGTQMFCASCHEPLWFRAASGEMFAAMPGSLEIEV